MTTGKTQRERSAASSSNQCMISYPPMLILPVGKRGRALNIPCAEANREHSTSCVFLKELFCKGSNKWGYNSVFQELASLRNSTSQDTNLAVANPMIFNIERGAEVKTRRCVSFDPLLSVRYYIMKLTNPDGIKPSLDQRNRTVCVTSQDIFN